MPGYTLSSLIPEPFVVTDPAGDVRYEGLMLNAFGAIEYARYERLSREFDDAWPVLQGKKTGDREAAAAVVDSVVHELVASILPTIPEERRRALTFGERLGIVQAWQEAQPAPPKVTARQSQTPAKRSRASSSPATTRRPS